MIIEPKFIVKEKIERLKNGETAFAESDEVIRLLERDVAREKLDVLFEKTPAGCWITPQKNSPEIRE